MRVLLSCPYAWDAPGGVQTHVRQLAAALGARGHEVAVVAPARALATEHVRATEALAAEKALVRERVHATEQGPAAERTRPTDASHERAEAAVHLVGRSVSVPWGGSVAPLCASAASLRRIRAVAEAFAPDVIHAHEPFSPSTSMLATLAATAPVVGTFHSFIERSRLMELAAPLLRIVDRRLAAAVAVSEAAAECAERVVGRRVDVVPNGVAMPRAPSLRRVPAGEAGHPPRRDDPPGGRVVLWVHRLDPRKGFPVAVRAFAILAGELEDVRFVVAGDGRDRDAIRFLPEPLRRRVAMLGTVPDAALASLRSSASVFVAAAIGRESFGVSLVEAMAAGLPVVASDIAGYREVVRPGLDGLLVPPSDPGALARALRRVLDEPALAASLARAGRERAREYSWDAIAPRLESIYERFGARTRSAAPAASIPRRRSVSAA